MRVIEAQCSWPWRLTITPHIKQIRTFARCARMHEYTVGPLSARLGDGVSNLRKGLLIIALRPADMDSSKCTAIVARGRA
jgi:hypothetical protein